MIDMASSPLEYVALAGGTEHRYQTTAPRRRHRREYVQDLLERCRRMGVVDDDAEWLAAVHALHPARHSRHRGKGGTDGGSIQFESLAEGDGGKGVVDVEPAGQPQIHLAPPARSGNFDAHGLLVHSHADGPHVGPGRLAVPDDPGSRTQCGRGEERRGVVIGIHDPGPRPWPGELLVRHAFAQPPEQAEFGLAIRLEGSVQLEMLMGQVR
jgi:hypothetical protein